jgi:hypothetical protein
MSIREVISSKIEETGSYSKNEHAVLKLRKKQKKINFFLSMLGIFQWKMTLIATCQVQIKPQ